MIKIKFINVIILLVINIKLYIILLPNSDTSQIEQLEISHHFEFESAIYKIEYIFFNKKYFSFVKYKNN